MTTESEEALELAREAGIELDTDEVLEPAPIYYIEEASIIRLVRLAKQRGAEEQKRKDAEICQLRFDEYANVNYQWAGRRCAKAIEEQP